MANELKYELPFKALPEVIDLFVSKIVSLKDGEIASSTHALEKSFLKLHLMHVSWNSSVFKPIVLKYILAELRILLDAEVLYSAEFWGELTCKFKDKILKNVMENTDIDASLKQQCKMYVEVVYSQFSSGLEDFSVIVSLNSNLISRIVKYTSDEAFYMEQYKDLIKMQDEAMLKIAHNIGNHSSIKPRAEPVITNKNKQVASQDSGSQVTADALVHQDASSGNIILYDIQEALSLLSRISSEGGYPGMPGLKSDEDAKVKKELALLAKGNPYRGVAKYDDDKLKLLYSKFPNFKAVLDFIIPSLQLSSCGSLGRFSKLPPILLRGVPGTGKSKFADELARALGTPFHKKDLAVTSSSMLITGRDTVWKGAKPGIVYEALVHGQFINPTICLDEADKCDTRSGSGASSSPLSALYTLLEGHTAIEFQDEFVTLKIDASHINWILTANDGELPDPIVERLEIFEIPYPTYEECLVIAQSIWKDLCVDLFPQGHPFSQELSPSVCAFAANMSPRQIRKVLTYAAGLALVDKKMDNNGKVELTTQHLEAVLKDSRYKYSVSNVKKSIGFLSE